MDDHFTHTQPGSTNSIPSARNSRRVYLIAALVVAIVLIIPWLIKRPAESSQGSLFADHFEVPAISDTRGENTDEIWAAAMTAYANQQFDEVIPAAQKAMADSSFNKTSQASLIMGISHLAMDHPEEAMKCLKMVNPTSFHADNAHWYMALTHIKMGHIQEARTILEGIKEDPRHEHYQDALDVLARI